MAFETVTLDLSFDKGRIGEAGNLTANYYTVPGVTDENGALRALSIGQLVMALCLARATELESQIIKIVEDLEKTSENLERLSEIESAIVNATSASVDLKNTCLDGTSISYYDFLTAKQYGIGLGGVPNTADSSSEKLISDMESKMDSLNSFSQQTMIDLQSLTAKRDQSYDMISNILKSLNTTLLTNVNNM